MEAVVYQNFDSRKISILAKNGSSTEITLLALHSTSTSSITLYPYITLLLRHYGITYYRVEYGETKYLYSTSMINVCVLYQYGKLILFSGLWSCKILLRGWSPGFWEPAHINFITVASLSGEQSHFLRGYRFQQIFIESWWWEKTWRLNARLPMMTTLKLNSVFTNTSRTFSWITG